MEIFNIKSDIESKADSEIYITSKFWIPVRLHRATALEIHEFKDFEDTSYFVHPGSWRIRKNFGEKIFGEDDKMRDFTSFAELEKWANPSTQHANHKCMNL